jgi:hypothetical protein
VLALELVLELAVLEFGEFWSGTTFLLVKALTPITIIPKPIMAVMINAVVIAEACFIMFTLLRNKILCIYKA